MNLEKYIPQLIASGIVIVVLYLIRFVVHKVVMYYGQLLQKSTVRRKQIKQILYVLLNILLVFALAIIWGVNPENLLIGLSSIFAVIGVAMFAQCLFLVILQLVLSCFLMSPSGLVTVFIYTIKICPLMPRLKIFIPFIPISVPMKGN